MKKIWLLTFAIMSIALSQCECDLLGIKKDVSRAVDEVTKAVALFDVAINKLENNSSDWQETLKELETNLAADAKGMLKNEVADILSRSIAGVGTEVKCIIDFTGIRVKQQLENLKSQLLGLPKKPFYPNVCSIVPAGGITLTSTLTATTEKMELYGFDFDRGGIQITLEDESGSRDVSEFIDIPTNYLMTLNLGGTGIQFSKKSKRLIIKARSTSGETSSETTLYTIGVFQPLLSPCNTRIDKHTPQGYTHRPFHTRGDKEFNGHGPNVWFDVALIPEETQIKAKIHMKAEETQSDWTTAEKTEYIVVYTAPPGTKIVKIVGETYSACHYRDTNHSPDIQRLNGPVQLATFIGDTGDDNDAGDQTKVDITFAQLQVQIIEIGDCIPPEVGLEAIKVSPSALKLLREVKSMH